MAQLYRLLDLHGAATLAPLIPSLEGKAWLAWPGMSHNLVNTQSRRLRARMENCTTRGVWALLFERTEAQIADEEAKWELWREEDEADAVEGEGSKRAKSKGKSKSAPTIKSSRGGTIDSARGTRSRSRSYAGTRNVDEDERPAFEAVTPTGWLLLDFLVAFWTKDAAEHNGHPDAFLSQLWRPSTNLAFDLADAPLEIVRQAVYESTGADAIVRRRLAASLIKFLVDAATGKDARFHSQSLASVLLPLFREERVVVFIALLRSSLPAERNALPQPIMSYGAFTHFLTHAIEDAAGVRREREAQRLAKRRGKRARGDPSIDHFEEDGLAAPTVAYVISLLGLPAAEADDDAATKRMDALKIALVTALASNVPSPLWAKVTDTKYALLLRVVAAARDKAAKRAVERASEENESLDSLATESTLRRSSTPPSLSLSPAA